MSRDPSLTWWHRSSGKRYAVILTALLALLVTAPLLPDTGTGARLLGLVVFLVALAGAWTLRRLHGSAAALVILGSLVFTSPEWGLLGDRHVLEIARAVAMIVLLALLARVILRDVLTTSEITLDTIFGATSVYLLIGYIWAFAYSLSGSIDPTSIAVPRGELLPASEGGIEEYFYFSFVTLTTLGYGDIQPVSPIVRTLAILEALLGQLYVVILLARLVSVYKGRHG